MTPPWMDAFEPLQSPAPVSWWPPAPGWWLMGIALLALLIVASLRWRVHVRRNRYRRILRKELDALWQSHRPDLHPDAIGAYLAGCCERLRRAWSVFDARRAALPARDLLASLEETPGVIIPRTVLHDIEPLLYGRNPTGMTSEALDLPGFHRQLLIWSRHHRREPPC